MYDQELRDFERKAGFIDRHSELYRGDPDFRRMVDFTVYLTPDQRHESEAEVGRLHGNRAYLGLS
jgi:hypothetical protein